MLSGFVIFSVLGYMANQECSNLNLLFGKWMIGKFFASSNFIRTVHIYETIKKLGTTVDEVAESGPGLVFIAYPKALR